MRIALAPIPYLWPRERVFAFYRAVERAPVDTVYLGETVCLRRRALDFDDWLRIAEALATAGREAVLSTPVLVEGEGELKWLRRVAANGRFRIEANDLSAVRVLSHTSGWVAGAPLNVYNPRALAVVQAVGATRWVAPYEATRELVADMHAQTGIESEVFAHGRLPLAHSARCFTARRCERQKEDCGVVCAVHPAGLALRTQEGEALFVLNGVQTLSAVTYSLLDDLAGLAAAGVSILRVAPEPEGTLETVALLRAALAGDRAAGQRLAASAARGANGFWHGAPGRARCA